MQIEIKLHHPLTGLERTLYFTSELPAEELMWMLKQMFETAPQDGANTERNV